MEKESVDSALHIANILKDLHTCWTPHDGQVAIGKAIFYEGKQFVLAQCGRKFGKTDIAVYLLMRAAMTTPGAACYFIAPYQKQAKELIWANGRIQYFLSEELRKKYIRSVNNSEMRVTFENNSFIKLDGADNYEAYRGINPHVVVYDEFKDHHPKFHEGMEPNLATYAAPLLVIGTPPETDDNLFTRLRNSWDGDEDASVFNFPSWSNPHIDKKWLLKQKERLYERGEWDVWMREYEAKPVKGGSNAIFPMFDKEKHVKPFDELVKEIQSQRKKFDYYVTADPATSSVFGVLLTAVHRYTRIVYHLDELYISDTRETSTRKVYRRLVEAAERIHPIFEEWVRTYDEAAAWFPNEVLDLTDGEYTFFPTHKRMNKKDDGLSLIKDQMLLGFFKISDRCKSLKFEIENYVKDQHGKIPKENDHLIDCMRYTNAAANYSMIPLSAPKKPDPDTMPRYKTMDDDIHQLRMEGDWTIDILGEDYYD